uniref:G protein-coupled receptor n=1 Tax=Angiostrongylus cantonensis TaxID=6313 RepID=A0A0K0D8D1_ANGCA
LKALLIMDHAQLFTTVATVFMPQICDLHHSGNHTLYGFCMFQRRFLKHVMPRLANFYSPWVSMVAFTSLTVWIILFRIEATVNTIHVWTIAALSAHRYWKVNPLQSYQCFHR